MLVSIFALPPTSHPPLLIDCTPVSPFVVSQNTVGRMNAPHSSPNRSAGVMLDWHLSARISQSVCLYSHVSVTVFPIYLLSLKRFILYAKGHMTK